jgi:nicotinate-nucleotide pyrophosphorylase (carboxylating)
MPAPTATSAPLTGPARKVAHAYRGEREVTERLEQDIERIALTALYEDLGFELSAALNEERLTAEELVSMDVTGNATVPASARARAAFMAKSEGVVAGLEAAFRVFQLVEPDVKTKALCQDGTVLHRIPQRIATVEGSARALLVAERSALNILQRLSGIATVARQFAEKAAPLGISILDTRKTTPGLRTLEKYAVRIGGAVNHRYGLFDAVLIKDNHVCVAGGVSAAIKLVRQAEPELPVQVEVTNLRELEEALREKAEKIILDNMAPEQIRDAVAMASGRSILEVSGGVNFDNIDDYLIKGVDAISIGALTHSVRSLDISLEIEV